MMIIINNREIKFRIWNSSEMVYDNILVGAMGIVYVNPENGGINKEDTASISINNTIYPKDISAMQFTGLYDKDEKDIYEGDIMSVYENGKEYLYKVLYDEDCFMLGFINSKQGSYPLLAKSRLSIVVGNIYENLDLFIKQMIK